MFHYSIVCEGLQLAIQTCCSQVRRLGPFRRGIGTGFGRVVAIVGNGGPAEIGMNGMAYKNRIGLVGFVWLAMCTSVAGAGDADRGDGALQLHASDREEAETVRANVAKAFPNTNLETIGVHVPGSEMDLEPNLRVQWQ